MVDDEEKKAKSGLLRRWLGGGEAATTPVDELPLPAATEAELPPAASETQPLAEAPSLETAVPPRPRRSRAGFSACEPAYRARRPRSRGA